MRRLATPLLFVFVTGCVRSSVSPTVPMPPSAASAMPSQAVSAEELRRDLEVFAADSFMGREAGTTYAVKAAQFLADRLRMLGVEPAGDSGYFQRLPLARQALGSMTRFTVTTPAGVSNLAMGADLVPLLSLGPGAPLPRLEADGDIVFLGYALQLPEQNRDDFAKVDLTGKTVVFTTGAPAGLDPSRRAQLEQQSQVGIRVGNIMARRPAAIIVLGGGEMAAEIAAMAEEMSRGPLTLDAATASGPRPLPMVLLGAPRAGSPLLPAGWPADDRAQLLAGRRFSARVEIQRRQIDAFNVAGVIRGADPSLRGTYVAFGAHLDHIGTERPVAGDSIANGADDDGSGSMALLWVARALQAAPRKPRRSVLFIWHTGEEAGLLGSEYFTNHPTVPLDSIIAQLNADMIGRNAPDSIYLVGPRAAPNGQSSVLGSVVDSVNAAMPRPFFINREWDAPDHPEMIYFRSDHYSYAKHGIPIVFFTTGLHEDYHKVSDEIEKIDFDKLARVSALLLQSGLAVADRLTRPVPAIP